MVYINQKLALHGKKPYHDLSNHLLIFAYFKQEKKFEEKDINVLSHWEKKEERAATPNWCYDWDEN